MTDEAKTEAPEPTESEGEIDASQLLVERDEYHDLLLRKAAELENYKKRTERDRASLQQTAAADLIQELLPLADDLERALASPSESTSTSAYRSGVELIHKRLLELLEKRGVMPIEAMGANFDPLFHEAVETVTAENTQDGRIISDLRRGYTLRGRLLRPSMVRVAKA
jgi:molecular chaperone GrpE